MKNVRIKIIGSLFAAFMALPLFGMELAKPEKKVITGTFCLNSYLGFAYAAQDYHQNKLCIKNSDISIPIVHMDINICGFRGLIKYDDNYNGSYANDLKKRPIKECLLSELMPNKELIKYSEVLRREYPEFILELRFEEKDPISGHTWNGHCPLDLTRVLGLTKDTVRFLLCDNSKETEEACASELIKAGVISKKENGVIGHGENSFLNTMGLLGKNSDIIAPKIVGTAHFVEIYSLDDSGNYFVSLRCVKDDASSIIFREHPLNVFTQWVKNNSVEANINYDDTNKKSFDDRYSIKDQDFKSKFEEACNKLVPKNKDKVVSFKYISKSPFGDEDRVYIEGNNKINKKERCPMYFSLDDFQKWVEADTVCKNINKGIELVDRYSLDDTFLEEYNKTYKEFNGTSDSNDLDQQPKSTRSFGSQVCIGIVSFVTFSTFMYLICSKVPQYLPSLLKYIPGIRP